GVSDAPAPNPRALRSSEPRANPELHFPAPAPRSRVRGDHPRFPRACFTCGASSERAGTSTSARRTRHLARGTEVALEVGVLAPPRHSSGYTLIEVAVVILILGLLFGFSIPTF